MEQSRLEFKNFLITSLKGLPTHPEVYLLQTPKKTLGMIRLKFQYQKQTTIGQWMNVDEEWFFGLFLLFW